MRKFIGFTVIASMLVLSACNTVRGVGRDVQSAGDAVEKTAD
jgi:predicted small secreted protein